MKLVTTARQLRSALAQFKGIIEKRTAYPILACVLFDGRTVRGTDLDMMLQVEIAATEAEGRAALDYHTLAVLVPLLPAEDLVTIETNDNGEQAILTCGPSRYVLPSIDPDGFPDLKGWDAAAENAVPDAMVNGPVRTVSRFISNEETRYYLNGVCFSRDHDGRPVLVATDGHRLAAAPLGFDAAWLDGKIVYRRAVDILARMPGAPRIETVTGMAGVLRFTWPGTILLTKLIEGTYPDWKRVVPAPADDARRLRLPSGPLLAALRRLAALRGRMTGYVTLAFNAEGCIAQIISADLGIGTEQIVHLSAWAGDAGQQVVSLNGQYLIDMLRLLQQADEIELTFKDQHSPITVSAPDVDLLAVQMPARGADDNRALRALETAFPIQTAAAE